MISACKSTLFLVYGKRNETKKTKEGDIVARFQTVRDGANALLWLACIQLLLVNQWEKGPRPTAFWG
ncbi:hypothetical protein HMPREF6745_0692 [Prevotella sp. oral taxon 472 str. F0295]|nr:hypothetical protein HMPREF6745_0692 [Prevotella sp. oral taxon 472 str. F0295]